MQDIAASMTNSLARDGRGGMTGPLRMNGQKIVGLAPGVEPTDAATVSQITGGPRGPAGPANNTAPEVAEMAASATTNVSAYLALAGRSGTFIWRTGDYTQHVALDVYQGKYVASTLAGLGPSVGCWVRDEPTPGEWHTDWFSVPSDPAGGAGGSAEVQAHPQANAMIALANLVKPHTINFGSKIYTFGAAPTPFTYQVSLLGARGGQGTILVKRYNEADDKRGVLAFNNASFVLRDFDIRATAGSGGSGYSGILTGTVPVTGETILDNVRVSMGTFANYSRVFDGRTNTSGAPGYRNIKEKGCSHFGAAQATLLMVCVQHWEAVGSFSVTAGGSSPIVLQTATSGGIMNDDFQYFGTMEGTVNLNGVSRSQFVSPQIGAINVDATTTTTTWVGPRVTGVVTNLAGAGFSTSWDGSVVASSFSSDSGWRRYGDGRLEQWGAQLTNSVGLATNITLPMAFTSSNIAYNAATTSDPGNNLVSIANVLPGANPLTQYSVKAANLNYAAIAVAPAASTAIRWFAHGQ